MSKTLDFKVFCLTAYKTKHELSGQKAFELFQKYGVFSYLESCYDVLHTTGRDYLIEDIEKYIQARQKTA